MNKPASQKPRLGRGLSSLISSSIRITEPAAEDAVQTLPRVPPSAPQAAPGQYVPVAQPDALAAHVQARQELAIDQISVNPYQPRRDFKPDELAELAQSIRQQGVLQPIIVTPALEAGAEHPYIIIAGERRLRASKLAGLKTIPAVVRQATREQMLEWALVENIQRSDLNAVEKAQAYRQYMDRFGLTQLQAAERLGQARTTVANILRVLDLCDEVQRMLVKDDISFGHAKVLAGIVGAPQRQLVLAKRVVDAGLSVRELEELVAMESQEGPAAAAVASAPKARPAYIKDLEDRLTQVVGTRVNVLPGRARNTGRIVLEYYSLEDFDRIAGRLGMSTDGQM